MNLHDKSKALLDFRNWLLLLKKLNTDQRGASAAALDKHTYFGAVQFAKHLCPCFRGREDQHFQKITTLHRI
jgi:hypothetical protein